jgi:hypothetical protein
MKDIVNKITQKNKIDFFENVCSCRTNSELLQNLRNHELCNRGIEYYD